VLPPMRTIPGYAALFTPKSSIAVSVKAALSMALQQLTDEDFGDGVLRGRWAAVPVERDAFLAAVESEAAGLAGDGKEGLERLAVQSSAGSFGAVVGHEVDHEIVCCGRHESREGTAEVIRIIENRPPGVVVGVGCSFGEPVRVAELVELLEPAGLEDTDSATVEVSIALDRWLAKTVAG
jgi:hypothetical protein